MATTRQVEHYQGLAAQAVGRDMVRADRVEQCPKTIMGEPCERVAGHFGPHESENWKQAGTLRPLRNRPYR